MIKVDKYEISKEIFGLICLIDSENDMLKQIASSNKIANYVENLPKINFKVKTLLRKNSNHKYVDELNLNINKRIKELNIIEKKKLLFLVSIFTQKEVIILDEPLLLLNKKDKSNMINIIRNLNKCVIVKLNNIRDAKLLCDRAVLVKNNKYFDFDLKSNYKWIKIKAENINKVKLPLKNMKIDSFDQNQVEFIYNGEINELFNSVKDIKILDIEIRECELEEIIKIYLKNIS